MIVIFITFSSIHPPEPNDKIRDRCHHFTDWMSALRYEKRYETSISREPVSYAVKFMQEVQEACRN